MDCVHSFNVFRSYELTRERILGILRCIKCGRYVISIKNIRDL